MSIFTNKFFSIAGQKERLTNVKEVVGQSISIFSGGPKPTANVTNKTGKAALEYLGKNPVSSGIILASGGTALGRGVVVKAVTSLGVKAKVGLALAGISTTALAVKSPKARVDIIKVASYLTPETLTGFVGGVVAPAREDLGKEPLTLESGINFLKNHPYVSAAAAGILLLGAGYSAVLIAKIVATYYQTSAAKKFLNEDDKPPVQFIPSGDNKRDNEGNTIVNVYNTPQTPVGLPATAPVGEQTPALAKKTTKKKKKTTKKKKKTTKKKKKTTKKKSKSKKKKYIKKKK
jgi:hypothetical protein